MRGKGLLCVVFIIVFSALPARAQDSEDLENVQEIVNFVGGPTSDAFPNSKPEVCPELHGLVSVCQVGYLVYVCDLPLPSVHSR